jgi:hypothetical protein
LIYWQRKQTTWTRKQEIWSLFSRMAFCCEQYCFWFDDLEFVLHMFDFIQHKMYYFRKCLWSQTEQRFCSFLLQMSNSIHE